ncbi:Z-ring associated protein ZapG [Vibrio aphrogenes]|uniref:Z-ring associated protein ZapG n=1 Tax=Vibrio aphrogenes TaxID=1891186 RepID=UPI000B35FABD|nr:Z-ring associated protein ZapG [Vibrio aphrogenes]
MVFLYAAVGLVIGIIIGIIIARLMTPEYKKHKQLQKELETTKFELEQHRQDLSDHFSNTAEMLDSLGKSYTKLYQHMAQTSSDLLPNLPKQENPFITQAAEESSEDKHHEEITDVQPKDYANGSTGLLKDQKKTLSNSPEMNKAS